MIERLAKFLLGYDFFISYAYEDGRQYAERLNDQLTNLDYACFFDADELPPGQQLPFSLRRAIKRSKAFVLVGTEGTIDAPYVNLEVSYGLQRGKLIPIDIDGIRERVPIPGLAELPWVNEEPEVTSANGPSLAVLEKTSNYFIFSKRNTLTRQIVSAMAAVFFIVAVVAVWQWREAVNQRTIAEEQRDIALSGQLSGQSRAFVGKELDLALLLAAAAGKLGDTFEARDALLAGLQRTPGLQKLLHGAGRVRTLAFSADGTYLANGASKGFIHLWDAGSGRRMATLNTPNQKSVRRLAFGGENETLIAFDKKGVLATWRLLPDGPHAVSNTVDHEHQAATESGAASLLLKQIEERDGKEVRTSAVSVKQDLLATSDGETVRIWNVKNGEQVGPAVAAQQRYVRALAFSPTGAVAIGSSAGTIAFYKIGRPIAIGRPLKGLKISANSFAFSPDGTQLAGGDYNGDIALWQLDDQSVKRRYIQHGSNVHGLEFGPGNQLAAFGGDELKIWDLGTGELVKSFSMTMKLMSTRVIGPNFETAALGGNSGEISLWDMQTGKLRLQIPNQGRSRLTTMAFHPNGNILAAACNGRYVHLFDVATGQVVAELEGHKRAISDLDFSADGSRLASYDSEGTLMVWDMTTHELLGRPLQRTRSYSGSSAMALSPDGQIAVTSNTSGGLNIWHVDTWRSLGSPVVAHSDYVGKLVFSADGDWLVSGGLGGEVFLWDLRLETWIEQACRIANRDLTERERILYLANVSDMDVVCAP